MRLKKLELHGYKTFAGRTDFVFNGGITAIVGPNGSGKSNVADAVRWVLGEQRIGAMRARKTEDMIFNGTERRARMGMAQAFLTIDNCDGELPLDFTEIVVGRRTYRSGENEYLINGQKVRLRDVQELLGHAGIGTSTYTVIGQGLVDAALALRAEERRQLFEDAAGLGAYQGKREEAMRRLAETDDNLTRARDIIAELEPRLRRLRRQAERAEEHAGLTEQLQGFLRHWYGYRWGQAGQAVVIARAQLVHTANELEAAVAEVQAIERRIEHFKGRQQALREQLEAGRRERNRLRAESERVRRDRAVAEERGRLLNRQSRELEEELAQLAAEESALQIRAVALAAEGTAFHSRRAEAEQVVVAAERRLREAERERDALRAALDGARREASRLIARRSEVTQRKAQAAEREAELVRELDAHRAAMMEMEQRLARREGEMALLEEELEALRVQRRHRLEERRRLLDLRGQAQEHARRLEGVARDAQAALDTLRTRRELLDRLRREGAGYQAGVRALLAAARQGELAGIRGPVAAHLRVPPELAPAVGAALGSRLEAVVVADAAAAEMARVWLDRQPSGRVMLLAAERLVPRIVGVAPQAHQVIGRAAEMVQADDPTLLEYLLGDWLIVEGWSVLEALSSGPEPVSPVASPLFHDAGWNIVTLDGLVARADGSIEAGREQGNREELLGQSREWAALPGEIGAAEEASGRARLAHDEAVDAVHELEQRIHSLDQEIREIDRRSQRAEQRLQRERRDAEKLRHEQTWREGLATKVAGDVDQLRQRTVALDAEMVELEHQAREAESALQRAENLLEAAHPGTLREAVERARTAVAIVDEQLTGWRRQSREQAEAESRLKQRRAAKERQRGQLEQEHQALAASSALLVAEADRAEAALSAIAERLAPLERERQAAEEQQTQLEECFTAARKKRHEREEAAQTARLALQAADDRIAHLSGQIEADLGMVDLDEISPALAHQPALPIDELVTTLPKVTILPEGIEEDIRLLRRRIGQIGAINPEAPAEYRELEARYCFLVEQSADLQGAGADLRQVVGELDQIMRRRFQQTFDAVNRAFKEYFTRLFNGGAASLELTGSTDVMTSGIEIIARPPGKRSQSIALLSGGERALTAAALIFAILKVSPAPFCVLDEVDAMLDEANVGRFRDMLAELARETQFIVITHNRGTIEAADTIYGISQSESGISDVISLALDQAIRQAKQ